MNDIVVSTSVVSPHLLRNPQDPLYSTPFSSSDMSSRKRKADDDADDAGADRMSSSPSPAPSALLKANHSTLPRQTKRARTNVPGRPLALPRLLETLDADDMRTMLQSICDRHPDIGNEFVATAPRPSVQSALRVLNSYQSALRESFPYGDRPSSEYSYNRVRHALIDLIEALKDYTPHFLPPNEQQASTSLAFLDGATDVVHQLPSWDSYRHDRHKQEAYEEIARAWINVIREAAKKGGGIQLQVGGWDQKVAKHNEVSGGKLQDVVTELRANLGWIGYGPSDSGSSSGSSLIRQQLASGTYGMNLPVQVGPW